jgi:hypothetical protein
MRKSKKGYFEESIFIPKYESNLSFLGWPLNNNTNRRTKWHRAQTGPAFTTWTLSKDRRKGILVSTMVIIILMTSIIQILKTKNSGNSRERHRVFWLTKPVTSKYYSYFVTLKWFLKFHVPKPFNSFSSTPQYYNNLFVVSYSVIILNMILK